jgi:hypothetical protein
VECDDGTFTVFTAGFAPGASASARDGSTVAVGVHVWLCLHGPRARMLRVPATRTVTSFLRCAYTAPGILPVAGPSVPRSLRLAALMCQCICAYACAWPEENVVCPFLFTQTHCRVVAMDLRGHGSSRCKDESDLSWQVVCVRAGERALAHNAQIRAGGTHTHAQTRICARKQTLLPRCSAT